MSAPKFSLSFTKKIEKKSLQPSAIRNDAPQEQRQRTENIESIEENVLKTDGKEEEEELVIPMVQLDRVAMFRKLAEKRLQEDQEKTKGEEGEGEDKDEAKDETKEPSPALTLDERAAAALVEESKRKLEQWTDRGAPTNLTIPVKEEDDGLFAVAKESSLDNYDQVQVESFGAALLRGMGWHKSTGVGKRNRQVVEIIDASTKAFTFAGGKPGAKQDTGGAQEQVEEDLVVQKGSFVFIHSGRQRGTYGVVETVDEDHVLVKAAVSGAVVREVELNLRAVTEKEFRDSSRVINKEMYDKFKAEELKKQQAKKKKSIPSDTSEDEHEQKNIKEEKKEVKKETKERSRSPQEVKREKDENVKIKTEKDESVKDKSEKNEERKFIGTESNRRGDERDEKLKERIERREDRHERKEDNTDRQEKNYDNRDDKPRNKYDRDDKYSKYKQKEKYEEDKNSKNKYEDRDGKYSKAKYEDKEDKYNRNKYENREDKYSKNKYEEREEKHNKNKYNDREDKYNKNKYEDREEKHTKAHKEKREDQKRKMDEWDKKGDKKAKHSPDRKVVVIPWVRENLRVRIISKDYKGGKYHKEKVVVRSVETAERCECVTSEGRVLRDVHPAWLETVIPKTHPMVVMVVKGNHKGQRGRILELHKGQEKASIQMLDDETFILKLHYDDICEYARG